MEKRKVGFYTGSFDPADSGHLNTALFAMESSGMALVRMVLSEGPAEADEEDRWRMLVAACADYRKLIPLRISQSVTDASGETGPEESAEKIMMIVRTDNE